MSPGYYCRSLDGHRASYLNFVISRFGGGRVTAVEIFLTKKPILFLMIEENFGLYLLASLWRTLMGLHTAGLLFRPVSAVDAKILKLKMKKLLLRFLRVLPRVQTLSIVPVSLDPRIGDIVDGWIYDFQLWDLSTKEQLIFNQLRNSCSGGGSENSEGSNIFNVAKNHANGRPLLVSIGMQSKAKGIEILASGLKNDCFRGWAIFVAGKFAQDTAAARQVIVENGGYIVDKFISDTEIMALYAACDVVWCLYEPAYNQASGILGRAVQLGLVPLVRRGSLSEMLCKAENIECATADSASDLPQALINISTMHANSVKKNIFKENAVKHSENQLRKSLGFDCLRV